MRIGRLHKFQWQAKFAGRLHSIFHGHAYGKIHIGCSAKAGCPAASMTPRSSRRYSSRDCVYLSGSDTRSLTVRLPFYIG